MDPIARATLDRRILPIALTLGVAGDLLFRNGAPALSLTVAVTLLVAAASYLKRTTGAERPAPDLWMLGAIGCAAAFALLDGFVLALDAVALGTLIAAPTLRRYGAARTLPLFAFCTAIGYTVARTATGPFEIWGAVLRGTDGAASPAVTRTRPILLGIALAIPVLLVFGALFAAADPAFASVASTLVRWDVTTLVQDVVLFTAGTIGAAGALRAWFDPDPVTMEAREPDPTAHPTIDPLALSIAMGALTLVFTAYVALQFRYLFGGATVVQSVTGLTVAEYARHGFFQVVQATALVIPILLVVDDLTRTASVTARWRLRLMSRVQLVLTLIVLVSAMARMWMYVDNFGLTEDRVLSTTVLVWLALVLLWFPFTVLAERRARFTFGAVLAGYLCLALLNLSVPDALIMRENVQRAISGKRPLDVRYAVRNAGPDGISYLVAHLDELPATTRDEVLTALRTRTVHPVQVTGRSFNLARWRAVEALRTLPRK